MSQNVENVLCAVYFHMPVIKYRNLQNQSKFSKKKKGPGSFRIFIISQFISVNPYPVRRMSQKYKLSYASYEKMTTPKKKLHLRYFISASVATPMPMYIEALLLCYLFA